MPKGFTSPIRRLLITIIYCDAYMSLIPNIIFLNDRSIKISTKS